MIVTVPGFDYSDANGIINFTKAATMAPFCIGRAAYGLVPDALFKVNFPAAVKAGMINGVYQFGDYRDYAKNNVTALAKILAGLQPDFVCLDLEQNERFWPGAWPSVEQSSRLTSWVWDWVTAYQLEGLTYPTVLYTNVSALQQLRAWPAKLDQIVSAMALWLAWWNPGLPQPETYSPWPKVSFIQEAESQAGHAFGMQSVGVDPDYWTSDLDDLRAFVGQAQRGPTLDQRMNVVESILRTHGWMD